ncbi:MAG TPA: RNA polymerase sigma factor [Solirubrobacteraceae bacterium]
MEVSALKTTVPATALRGPSPLLRLQSDERLIALTRRGQHAAFETLFSRYHSRLLSFCRHMLGSREDAEDVLQEVFAAAFNAVLADERAINVRPWLYRIARNRSLNHLRRASAIGVDSMDIHFADQGLSTGDQVMRRESFRQLMGDVQQLPETQRTALLLREIDALSYDQIALAMETTVPSVKSLLVRARISLAEAAEARKLSCEEVRCELGEVAEGLIKITPPARRHLRDCERCRTFRKHLKDNNHALAAVLPVAPLLLLKRFILTKLGVSAGAGHVAGAGAGGATAGAGATAGVAAGAGAGAAGGTSAAGGLITAGAGAIATKAAATIAAAALVTAGAVAADHSGKSSLHRHRHTSSAAVYSAATRPAVPLVVRSTPQPLTTGTHTVASVASAPAHRHHSEHKLLTTTPAHTHTPPVAITPVEPTEVAPKPAATPPVVEVTTETTELTPTTTTPPPATTPPPVASTTTTGTTGPAPTPVTTTPTEPAPAPETEVPNPAGLEETGAPQPTAAATEEEPAAGASATTPGP